MKEIIFYFNDSSKENSENPQDSPHESLFWEQNTSSHLEDKNEQAHKIYPDINSNSFLS